MIIIDIDSAISHEILWSHWKGLQLYSEKNCKEFLDKTHQRSWNPSRARILWSRWWTTSLEPADRRVPSDRRSGKSRVCWYNRSDRSPSEDPARNTRRRLGCRIENKNIKSSRIFLNGNTGSLTNGGADEERQRQEWQVELVDGRTNTYDFFSNDTFIAD